MVAECATDLEQPTELVVRTKWRAAGRGADSVPLPTGTDNGVRVKFGVGPVDTRGPLAMV